MAIIIVNQTFERKILRLQVPEGGFGEINSMRNCTMAEMLTILTH